MQKLSRPPKASARGRQLQGEGTYIVLKVLYFPTDRGLGVVFDESGLNVCRKDSRCVSVRPGSAVRGESVRGKGRTRVEYGRGRALLARERPGYLIFLQTGDDHGGGRIRGGLSE